VANHRAGRCLKTDVRWAGCPGMGQDVADKKLNSTVGRRRLRPTRDRLAVDEVGKLTETAAWSTVRSGCQLSPLGLCLKSLLASYTAAA